MSVLLATLCINEMEWLPRLYEQHKDWPGMAGWVFVEAADRAYQRAAPEMVSEAGLSADGTSDFLRGLAGRDPRVTDIPFGFTANDDAAMGKVAARQTYMDVAAGLKPEFVVILDGDEFYTKGDQLRVGLLVSRLRDYDSFIIPKREIWRPPSVASEPLLKYEAVGGFWGIPCCHIWRWMPGVRYRSCHNTPDGPDGAPLNNKRIYLNTDFRQPQMVHMGYASAAASRAAKNRYYAVRGEERDPQRRWYVKSRAAFLDWEPGLSLPYGAKVVEYVGPVPEAFR
jgi:hypothetical protein